MPTQTGSIDFKSTKGFQSYASGQYATLTQVKGQFATCSTAAGTQEKAATIVPSDTGWALYTGATITVKFTTDNTHATPTLNVNSTGAKSIRDHTGAALTEEAYKWAAGTAMSFTYDGTYWRMQDTLSQRVTTAETAIEQNAESIQISAKKAETIDGNMLYDVDVSSLTKVHGPANRYFSDSGNSSFMVCDIRSIADAPAAGIEYMAHWSVSGSTANKQRGLCFYSGNYIQFVAGQQYTLSCWVRCTSGKFLFLHDAYNNAFPASSGARTIDSSEDSGWQFVTTTVTATRTQLDRVYFMARTLEDSLAFECDMCGFKMTVAAYATQAELRVASDSITSYVSSNYTAKEEFDNLEIGGRNLLRGKSSTTFTANGITVAYDSTTHQYHVYGTNTKTDNNWSISPYFYTGSDTYLNLLAGDEITLSTDTTCPSGLYLQLNLVNTSGNQYAAVNLTFDGSNRSKTATLPSTQSPSNHTGTGFIGIMAYCRSVDVTFRIKLERGNRATDWTPAPEDLDAHFKSVETAIEQNAEQITFRATKTDFALNSKGTNLYAVANQTNGYLAGIGTSIASPDSTKLEVTSDFIPVGGASTVSIQTWVEKSRAMWMAYSFYTDKDMSTTTSRPSKTTTGTYLAFENVAVPSTANYIRVAYRSYGEGRCKVELDGLTAWSEAPADTSIYAAKAEIKVTTDGISSTVSKIGGIKQLVCKYANTLPDIKTWSTHDTVQTYSVESTEDVRVGDTVYLKDTDSTRNCTVYIKGVVTAVPSTTSVTIKGRGYEDALPSNSAISSINQSAETIKIQASRVEIDGEAIFSSIKDDVANQTALEHSGSGTSIAMDDAATASLKELTVYGKSVQDGTPTPSAPVEIQSVGGANLLDISAFTQLGTSARLSNDGNNNIQGHVERLVPVTPNTTYCVEIFGIGRYKGVRIGWHEYTEGLAYTDKGWKTDFPLVIATNATTKYVGIVFSFSETNVIVTTGGTESTTLVTPTPYSDWLMASITIADVGRYDVYDGIGVSVHGGNLLDQSTFRMRGNNNGAKTLDANGHVEAVNKTSDPRAFNYATADWRIPLSAGTYTLSASVVTPSTSSASYIQIYDSEGVLTVHAMISNTALSTTGYKSASFNVPSETIVGIIAKLYDGVIDLQLEAGSTATEYEPYRGTVTPIPLQSYQLRSLPDGTRDELTVDTDGHVTMVQRVGSYTFPTSGITDNGDLGTYYRGTINILASDVPEAMASDTTTTNGYCTVSTVAGGWSSDTQNVYYDAKTRSDRTTFVVKAPVDSLSELNAAYAGADFTYPLATPQTIDLGTIDMPQVHDGDTVEVIAALTPSIDATWFSGAGQSVADIQSNVTVIDGARIRTGSIVAEKLASGTITSDQIAAGAISADRLDANALTLGNIEGLEDRLDAIDSSLSSISTETQWVHYDPDKGTVFGENGSANNLLVTGDGIDFNTSDGRAAWATNGVFHANEMEADTVEARTITLGDWALVQSGTSFYIDYIG